MSHRAIHSIFALLAFFVLWSAPAQAFEQTRSCYPIEDGRTPTCQKGQKSLPIQWKNGCTTWRNHSEFPDEFLDAVQRSFATWNEVSGSYFRAYYAGSTDQFGSNYDCNGGKRTNENVVSYVENWPDSLAGSDVVALTSVVYAIDSGEILDADIRMNADHFKWQNITQKGADFAVVDVQNIMTHEVGHFLGLEHSTDGNYRGQHSAQEATMFANTYPNETKRRVLDADDKAGVRAIYPVASAPSATCEAPSSLNHASVPDVFDGERYQCAAKGSGCSASYAPVSTPSAHWLLWLLALYAARTFAHLRRA